MRQMLQVLTVVSLCSGAMAGAAAPDAGIDPRLAEAQAAFDQAMALKKAGQYAEAIPKTERALSLWEAAHGGDHSSEIARCLSLMGGLHMEQGNHARAESLLKRALAIREKALGEDHPDVAQTLNILALLYKYEGKHAQAEPFCQRALAIREKVLGKDHPVLADSMDNIAVFYSEQGRYEKAEPLHQRALAIREKALGKEVPAVAASLDNLAILYDNRGDQDRAEPLFQRALAIREAAQGKDHPDVAHTLNNLARLYYHIGRYDRAEPLFQRALVIREAALGQEHRLVAIVLANLGTLYCDLGQYGRAEPLYQRALATQEAALGKDHPDVALSLNNLGTLYSDQGQYERAGLLFQRALEIWKGVFGEKHPGVAAAMNNLATTYEEQQQYDRAEQLHQRALAIRQAVLGKKHPDVATSLGNIGLLAAKRGQYRRAEPLFQRALGIKEKALGKTHPFVATTLADLADLYAEQGQDRLAEPLYQRALSIRETSLGRMHPDVAESLVGLARLRMRQHRDVEAAPLFVRALAISEARLRREALGFSGGRLARFLEHLDRDEERIYALARAHPENADVRRLAISTALLFKGRSVQETADTSRTILSSLRPEDRDTFERLRGLRTRFANLSLDGQGTLDAAEYQLRLKNLAEEGDALEADLAKRSAPLRVLTALPPPDQIVERVAVTLPADAALVELVAYTNRSLAPKPGVPESKLPAQLRYLAMLLFPDGHTDMVDLGAAGSIDAAASRLRDALAGRDAGFQNAARNLYQLTFKPLLPLLGNTRRLFLSPDGQLALVPFAALHDGRRFLADASNFTYLTSGRDLLPRPDDIPSSPAVVILADPDYSASSQTQVSRPDGGVALAAAERSYSVERFFTEHRAGLSGQRWVPLPGTRQEAEAIQRLLPQAQLFVGADASKERLLNLATPGILHIATHGFFMEDATPVLGGRGVDVVGPAGGSLPRLQDPLLRSGLALAGAGAPADLSYSVVTALELAGLNLWGTELVVLSACDTGRGEVKRGQGVYGLRRALVVAGAETLVVSLWKVDDETTRIMMESYYRNLLAGQGRAAALKQAMLSVRAQHPHPYYWAPFIALGRDTPLRAFAVPPPQQ